MREITVMDANWLQRLRVLYPEANCPSLTVRRAHSLHSRPILEGFHSHQGGHEYSTHNLVKMLTMINACGWTA